MCDKKTKSQKLKDAVTTELYTMGISVAEARKTSSLYRHNVNRKLGENPELYGHLLQKLPPELHHDKAEQAAYVALTLSSFVGNNGAENLASAIAKIPNNTNIIKRFRMAEMSKDIDELRIRLRGVLKLVASNGQKVNYANLAVDLYHWQYSKAEQIRQWERTLINK